MFAVQSTDVSFEAVGRRCQVANNPWARLSYFLQCVSSCLEDCIPSHLTRFEQHQYFDVEDKARIFALCATLSADLLIDHVFFVVQPGSEILKGSGNEFYKISEAKTTIAAAATSQGAILLEGREVRVAKIMVCTVTWYENNYIQPLKEISRELRRANEAPARQSNYNSNSSSSKNDDDVNPFLLCLCCLLCLPFIPFYLLYLCCCK